MTHLNSPADADFIERVVREVLAALRPKLNVPDPVPTSQAETNPQQAVQIANRLITLETLRGRIDKCRELRVSSKAIVTPAVVDELRDRRIKLVRCDHIGHASGEKNSQWQVAADRSPASQSAMQLLLASEPQLRIASGAASLTDWKPSPNGARTLIAITEDAMQTTFEFNSHRIKAAICKTAHDVKEACHSFQARVLVIDARCGLSHELVESLRQEIT